MNYLSLDKTAFSNGDLYTIITNREIKGKKDTITSIIKTEIVIKTLLKILLKHRKKVKQMKLKNQKK